MLYETICLFPGSQDDASIPSLVEKVKNILEKQGAALTGEEDLGRRPLSYRIKKEREGVYKVFSFEMEPEKVKGLAQDLTLMNEVLRFLTVKKEKIPAKPRVVRRRPVKVVAPVVSDAKLSVPKTPAEDMSAEKIKQLDKKLEDILTDVTV